MLKFGKWVAINVLVFLMFMEIAGLISYAILHGKLFYLPHEVDGHKIQLTMEVLHPYFGYSHQTNREDESRFTNNYGFLMLKEMFPEGYDYPTTMKDKDTVLVGVFGGSVGQRFVLSMQRTGVLHHLLGVFSEYQGKTIKVLQFSHAGYKQPQQLLVYSYFLSIGQKLDLVINIDGFNEIALTPVNIHNNVSYAMPVSFVYKRKAVDLLTGGYLSKYHLARSAIEGCSLASCVFKQYLLSQYYRAIHKMNEEKYYHRLEKHADAFYNFALIESDNHQARSLIEDAEDASIYQDALKLWRNATIHMKHLSDLHKIRYIHVIQPNQWYRPTASEKYHKQFTDTHAGKMEAVAVETAYPLLVEMSKTLEGQINIIELTDIFDRIPSGEFGEIYRDDCCHFTERGNVIIASEIVKGIAANDNDEEVLEKLSEINIEQFVE